LCTEIIEFTSPTETAVCNLASIALPRFVREKVWTVDPCFWSKISLHNLPEQWWISFALIFYFQDIPIESHPSKLVGSIGSKNRYFDFDKLAEVCFFLYNIPLVIFF